MTYKNKDKKYAKFMKATLKILIQPQNLHKKQLLNGDHYLAQKDQINFIKYMK